MGTDNLLESSQIPPIRNLSDFKRIYQKHVVNAEYSSGDNTRLEARKRLQDAVFQHLFTSEPFQKLPIRCNDLLEHNIISRPRTGDVWDPLEANKVCSRLENMILDLGDKPWRKDFHKIKRYGGFWKTQVEFYFSGMDKLLSDIGYRPDDTMTSFVLDSPPKLRALHDLASDLFLLGMECLVYHDILKHVSSAGFDIRHVYRCRINIRGNVNDCIKWTKTHCSPHSHVSHPRESAGLSIKPSHSLLADGCAHYTEIGGPLCSFTTEDSGGVDEHYSPLNSPASNRHIANKLTPKPTKEPIYSQVKKPEKKDLKDSGYISSPASTEIDVASNIPSGQNQISDVLSLNTKKDAALDSEELIRKSSNEPVTHYGFDSHLLDRSKPSCDKFKPATSDEHHMKSIQFLSRIEDHSPTQSAAFEQRVEPVESEWEFVRHDLLSRYGDQYIMGERGDILNTHEVSSGVATRPVADPRTNMTFSTFRAPTTQSQPVSVRSGSPLNDILVTKGTQRLHSAVPLPPVPSQSTATVKTPLHHSVSKPVNLPTVPDLTSPESSHYARPDDWSSVTASAIQSNMDRIANYRSASFYENLPMSGKINATNSSVDSSGSANRKCPPARVLYPPDNTKAGENNLKQERRAKTMSSPLVTFPPHSKRTDSTDGSPQLRHTHPVAMGNHWQCSSCTSFNIQGTEVCDICHKSRVKIAEISAPCSDGPRCPRCTLINAPGINVCSLCDYSFEDFAHNAK